MDDQGGLGWLGKRLRRARAELHGLPLAAATAPDALVAGGPAAAAGALRGFRRLGRKRGQRERS